MTRHILLLAVILAAASFPVRALEVMVQYPVVADQPVGFNDLTNGPARKEAFERAVEIWKTQLQGDVTVNVRAFFVDDSYFGGVGEVLVFGAGKPTSAWSNIAGLPFSLTFYYGAGESTYGNEPTGNDWRCSRLSPAGDFQRQIQPKFAHLVVRTRQPHRIGQR
jgi:hypothetical protein